MKRPAVGFNAVRNDLEPERIIKVPLARQFRWDGQAKRCPKKGEYVLLEGEITTACLVESDMTMTLYFIAVPAQKGQK